MSAIIKFDLKELRKLANDKNSCIIEKRVTQNLALQPWCLGNLKESVKSLLDYKIGKFDKEFKGILLSYKNLRILQNVGAIRNDNADINFQVQADYFIFRPFVGATLRGVVNKKSTTHLAILVHRVFNVVIPRPTEEPGNKWIGTCVQEGEEVVFRIVVLDLYGALPYIRGELDESQLKLGAEGDDETTEAKPVEKINVSYIKFDKTKPDAHKNIEDELLNSTSKTIPKQKLNNIKEQFKKNSGNINNIKINGKSSPNTAKNIDSDVSIVEKSRNKKSKIYSDITEAAPRQSKKHRKDT